MFIKHGAHNNTLGTLEVKKNVFNARTHHYRSAREEL